MNVLKNLMSVSLCVLHTMQVEIGTIYLRLTVRPILLSQMFVIKEWVQHSLCLCFEASFDILQSHSAFKIPKRQSHWIKS